MTPYLAARNPSPKLSPRRTAHLRLIAGGGAPEAAALAAVAGEDAREIAAEICRLLNQARANE
jgi:hypothetical protein